MTPLLLLLTTTLTGATASLNSRTHFPRHRPRAPENRNIFSPRMDYEEWTPLGRGDPLKNDPTYDYVPPVLERVHYWVDPSKRTPDPPVPNAEVMVLGERTDPPAATTEAVSSRFATMTLLDPFIKFMESSKTSLTNTVKSYLTTPVPYPTHTSYGPPPTTMTSYYKPEPLLQHTDFVPPPPLPKINALQRPPYTMLMPPPPPPQLTTTEVTLFATSSGTTSEASLPIRNTTTNDVPSSTTEAVLQVSTTDLANSENLYKPVAINMPEMISNETSDEVSFFLPTPTPQPLVFRNENHINHHAVKLPNFQIVPPTEKPNIYSFRPTLRPTTSPRALTTDPMFKHYKQPSETVRGPFYLIIQGHSKVKKYGASKNKVKAVSSNEINYEDIKMMDAYDFESRESRRQEKKLKEDDDNHPTTDENEEGATPSIPAGDPKEVKVEEDSKNFTEDDERKTRLKRFIRRKMLAVTTGKPPKKGEALEEEQLGLESLIALNDDYNSEDVINLLLKEEGQGSGLGNFVASLFGRSLKTSDEM